MNAFKVVIDSSRFLFSTRPICNRNGIIKTNNTCCATSASLINKTGTEIKQQTLRTKADQSNHINLDN